jgi:hypothetical protein
MSTDRRSGAAEGEVGHVDVKLIGMGKVRGLVAGNLREVSTDTHDLVAAMANSRVRAKQGATWPDAWRGGELAITVTAIRRRLGVMAVRCQASSACSGGWRPWDQLGQ